MNTAILYVCTGNYIDFWEQFYTSCEESFLPNHSKSYFIFTDNNDDDIYNVEKTNVNTYKIDNLSWPLNTLLRFEYFYKIKEVLKDFDYIFFFNANASFKRKIYIEDIFPNDENLVGVQHPGYYGYRYLFLPYERRIKKSTAYIKNIKKGSVYLQGCLSGGKANNYLELIYRCRENINLDLSRNIIARAHDESHLNKYLNSLSYKDTSILSGAFSYPEDFEKKDDIYILMRSKNSFSWYKDIKKVNCSSDIYLIRVMKKIIKRLIIKK
ncbi:family 6 glucosyltransferase [Shewanella mangrovi]|uniref:family 6 glucosyltransferase n=1 Tax=Shewanella mangrovi TaxID=1515746 RepID=UPI00068CE444|nr:family 6 glucosyltransferase [Shewanella mangrovi]